MKKILVTGFDPFDNEKINPALEVIKLLPKKIGGNEIKILEIPTVYKKSIEKIDKEIETYNPDYILSIGQAGGRTDISIKDNEGNQPIDEKIYLDGENAYFSTLPIKAIQNEITKNNIPASISNTAGTFVCNHVFYGVRYLIEKKYKGKKSGFIHIPYLPEQVIGKADTPSMSLDNILRGIIIAIETIFSVEDDIKKLGGSIC